MALSQKFVVGLIGADIGRSRTPAMHMQEGAAQGFALDYHSLDLRVLNKTADDLPELLAKAEAEGYAGLNITHPCKQRVIEHLDELSPHARALGAVNTVIFEAGRRIGHNTDWSGFFASFTRGLPDVGLDKVLQLGAGGAGSAVAYAALQLGVGSLAISDVDLARADDLAKTLNQIAGRDFAYAVDAADLAQTAAQVEGIINTTPMGMANYPGMAIAPDLLEPRHWVAEIVYFPLETELLRVAAAKGCRVLNGGGMAVFQAVDAFRLFTGQEPSPERMLAHFASM